jgi:dihydropteroate synthase
MGILNVTPDSFGDRASLMTAGDAARRVDEGAAVALGERLEADGADLIDVGGESTRPGAEPVSADAELARVIPVVRALVRRLKVPVSIDTYKAVVARAAIAEGASLVNDISGLRYDGDLAQVVSDAGAGLIVMHTRGRSKTMYAEAQYSDVVGEVIAELRQSLETARTAGIAPDQVIVDPGIGFAKARAHSYGVLAGLPVLADMLGRPVLAGPSRKSFLANATGRPVATERDWGTAAAVTAAVLAGAHIVRVHAVAEMSQVVRVAEEIRRHDAGLNLNGPSDK